jgi:hypothetical protein
VNSTFRIEIALPRHNYDTYIVWHHKIGTLSSRQNIMRQRPVGFKYYRGALFLLALHVYTHTTQGRSYQILTLLQNASLSILIY